MALTRVLLRPRKTLGSIARESCLFRSMVLGLIVFCLPMLTGCAAEGDSKSGPPKAEPIAQVNAAGISTVTPEGDFQSGPPKAEPIAQVNAAGEMEDVMTVTPKGGFQNEPTEAEPTYSPI